jgi:hypothetical protein
MKVAVVTIAVHGSVSVFLWLIGHIDTLSACGYACGALSYVGALGFCTVNLPGLETAGRLIPYQVNESVVSAMSRDVLSVAATELMLFFLVLLLAYFVRTYRSNAA